MLEIFKSLFSGHVYSETDSTDDDTSYLHSNINYKHTFNKTKLDFSFNDNTVHLSTYENYLEKKFNNFESLIKSKRSRRQSKKYFKKSPSPLPSDVELSEIERKSIHRRLSMKPALIR